jgi:hypothetical protein
MPSLGWAIEFGNLNGRNLTFYFKKVGQMAKGLAGTDVNDDFKSSASRGSGRFGAINPGSI